jgi:hypothetical protein
VARLGASLQVSEAALKDFQERAAEEIRRGRGARRYGLRPGKDSPRIHAKDRRVALKRLKDAPEDITEGTRR